MAVGNEIRVVNIYESLQQPYLPDILQDESKFITYSFCTYRRWYERVFPVTRKAFCENDIGERENFQRYNNNSLKGNVL